MGSNLVIVALPADDDLTWKVSSEEKPHMTLLFLGDADSNPNTERIVEFVQHAIDVSEHGPFYMDIDYRGTLGSDDADVLFFRKGWSAKWITQLRGQLLQNTDIKTAYDSTEQYPEWTPHLTLGYPTAKADDDKIPDYGLNGVRFDRIAVWTSNFDGPEFRLEWPEDFGMAEVGWSDKSDRARQFIHAQTLEHFGVKGMKWGQRKSETVSVGGKTKMVTPKKAAKLDKSWQKRIYTLPGAIDVHNGMAEHFNSRIGTLNDKYKDVDFSKTDWGNPNKWSPREHQYNKDVEALTTEGTRLAIKSVHGTSPSGKLRAELSSDGESIVVHEVKLKHADEASDAIAVLKLTRNSKGLVTEAEPLQTEKSMAQTEELISDILAHHGVKGMKWGVHKQSVTSGAKTAAKTVGTTASKGAKATVKGAKRAATAIGDANFETAVDSGHARTRVLTQGGKNYKKEDLPALNAKPEYQKARKTTYRLTHPRDSVTKAYRKEAMDAYLNQLEKTANSMQNTSKTRQYTIRERGDDLPAEGGKINKYFWDVSTRKVVHVADNHDDTTTVEVIMDKDGFIVDLKPVQTEAKSMSQSAITSEEFVDALMHFGIKGMRWGVRNNRPAPTASAPTAVSRVPHGDKRKTKIKVEGGQNHPAHEDAIKVAEARAKLQKSGVHALSNKELRDVRERVQLEEQVQSLMTSRGRKFVRNNLQNEGQNLARAGARAGVKKGVKKAGPHVRRAAATAATAALI